MTARLAAAATILGLAAAAVSAQQPSPPSAPAAGQTAAPPQRPIFTSAVDLARLDIVVTGADGRPVQDLRPDEVQVVEGSSPRPVLLLQRVAEAGRTYAEAAQRTVAAEVSTNQGAPRGQLYVLLFDQEHITPGVEQKVRLAAERFIKEKVQPQDRIAVYGLPAPGPMLPFTSNARLAIEQLANVRGNLERIVEGNFVQMTVEEAYSIMRGDEAVLSRFLTKADDGTTSRASATAELLDISARRSGESPESLRRLIKDNAQSIVTRADGDSRRFLQLTAEMLRSLRNVDGRKTVVLFSEGFHADNLLSEMRSVTAAAAETYAVVYALDLNDRVSNITDEPRGGAAAAEALNRTESIGGLAADTNGALVPDALNRLDDALASLGTPNNDYYVVGFEPSADAVADRGSYRRVTVKVTRPGARVSTRTGYTAGNSTRIDPSLPALRRITIDSALAAPYGHQGLTVEYTTYVSRGAGPNERVVLSLEAELPVATAGAEPADVVFVVRNARSGQLATSGADQIALPSAPQAGRSTGVGRWRVQFALPPGEYLMRCVVREPGGLIGSADRQFAVRALGGPDVAASDLVLGRPGPGLPVRATGYTATPLPGAVRLFARSADQLSNVSARLELLPVGGAAPALGVAAVLGDTRDVDGQTQRDLLFDVPLATVAPGDYVARVEVRSGGELVTELRRQVTVHAGAEPAALTADAAGTRSAARPADAADSEIARSLEVTARTSALPASRQAVLGVSLLRAGRYVDAAAALRASFDADPKQAGVAFVLGWAERGSGNNTAAITAFRNAALLDSSMIPAHLALAETYLDMKQPALAIQALEAGLASHPNAEELKRMLEVLRK